MAKFSGSIGFAENKETSPGVWEDTITEHHYVGDVIRNNRRTESGPSINDNIRLSNQISIIADPYLHEHYFAIRYVKWMGTAWKVENIEIQAPRLLLSIGGVYNGNTA